MHKHKLSFASQLHNQTNPITHADVVVGLLNIFFLIGLLIFPVTGSAESANAQTLENQTLCKNIKGCGLWPMLITFAH